jgi:hypothetical protein
MVLATVGFDPLDQPIPRVNFTPPDHIVRAEEPQRAESNQPENADADPNQERLQN